MRNCDKMRKSGQMTHAHHRERTRGRVAVNVKQSRDGCAAKAATPVAEYLHAFDGLLGCEELQDELQARECGGGRGGTKREGVAAVSCWHVQKHFVCARADLLLRAEIVADERQLRVAVDLRRSVEWCDVGRKSGKFRRALGRRCRRGSCGQGGGGLGKRKDTKCRRRR